MYNYLFDEVKYKEVSTSVWPHVFRSTGVISNEATACARFP